MNIEGITVLSQEPITAPTPWMSTTMLILAALLAVFLLIAAFTDGRYKLVGSILLIILVLFIVCGFICVLFEQETGRYTYKCLIDDTVSFNEISISYDIIDQEGKIFTLSDK